MKKLLIFALYFGLLGMAYAGQVEISLNGINPLNVNVAGVGSQQEAGGISVYVYFRNDGTTELTTTDNVTADPLETGFGWGTGLLNKIIETGSWNKGGYTFTRRLLYDNTSVFSQGDDYWPTAGLNAITLNFTTVGTGQAYVEANGSDALPDFSGTAPHTITYSNQEVTLPVELATFEAELAQIAVLLKWATASEENNQGFNLYRSEQENGSYEKLNGSLIPGNGTTTNTNEYEFRDDRIESNKYYYYRLEDVDINGQAKQHGPINIFIDPALMAPTEYSLDQ
ncbi:hypothetical protein GF406_27545, partial [candidate division KSB1 bacterium]|nr:hypothetical protein [candidate division KSB1 bacterium]